jgi:hypothetical protein
MALAHQRMDQIRPDKPGAARDKTFHRARYSAIGRGNGKDFQP